MSITNSLKRQVPGLGTPNLDSPTGLAPSSGFASVNNTISGTAAQSTSLVFPGGVTLSKGKLRIRVYNLGGTSPTIIVKSYLWDGTSAVDFLLPVSAFTITGTGSPSGVDILREFCTEINATTLVVVTTLGGTSPTGNLDIECYGPN